MGAGYLAWLSIGVLWAVRKTFKPNIGKAPMPAFKLVLSDPRSGKAKQIEVKDEAAQRFMGLKIGDTVDASILGGLLEIPQGFKVKITGGSGYDGAPMHPGIEGPVKRYVLLSGPPGYHPPKRGMRKRKLVRGNTINEQVTQVNAVLVYPEGWDKGPVIPVGDKEAQKASAKPEAKAEEKPQ